MPAASSLPGADAATDGLRGRVLDAAVALLTREGRDALTTRSVAAAAGVQAPALYRLFGDKRGLLDAVAEYGYAAYLSSKQDRRPGEDPLADLRAGWDLHVEFGLTHPAIYGLMVGDPRPGEPAGADSAGRVHLQRKIRALAQAGRLRVSEKRAALLFHAAASGLVLTLLSLPERERDPGLSALAREGVLATISTDVPSSGVPSAGNPGGGASAQAAGLAGAAVTLGALLPESGSPEQGALTPGERALLGELLSRLAGGERLS